MIKKSYRHGGTDSGRYFRYPGQYYDGETGLHWNWARYYDPGAGRYIRKDPIGFMAGINFYAYVTNAPVNWADPIGLERIYGPNFTCYGGPPKVVTTRRKETVEWIIWSDKFPNPSNWRPNFGAGSFPSTNVATPPFGPEIANDWWIWQFSLLFVSEFMITKTVSTFNYICVEERKLPCEDSETFRWESERKEEDETVILLVSCQACIDA